MLLLEDGSGRSGNWSTPLSRGLLGRAVHFSSPATTATPTTSLLLLRFHGDTVIIVVVGEVNERRGRGSGWLGGWKHYGLGGGRAAH